jgi:hypothetical protein
VIPEAQEFGGSRRSSGKGSWRDAGTNGEKDEGVLTA